MYQLLILLRYTVNSNDMLDTQRTCVTGENSNSSKKTVFMEYLMFYSSITGD